MRQESLERDIAYLKDMVLYCDKALDVIPKANRYGIPLDDDMVLSSIAMNLGQVGEQLIIGRLSEKTKDRFSDRLPWTKIKGFRNIAYHQYGRLDFMKIKGILDSVIPETRETLCELIRELERELSED